jgi:uncharacterized tellurite resistance protein B-like protein
MGKFGVDDLKLAFCMHMVDQIVSADDELSSEELTFLDKRFPASLQRARGFLDDQGDRTDTWHEAAMEALDRLPTELDHAQKLELLDLFVDATVADAKFETTEGSLLVDAARLLDLDDAAIDAFLAGRSEVGGAKVSDLDPT